MKTNRNNTKNVNERGIALFMAIFCLMLLSAIAAGFMFLANTETAINANNKAGQLAFFTSRAGLEEFKARIVPGATGFIAPPTALPNSINGQIFYILNPAAGEVVTPETPGTPYFDDTLCQAHLSDPSLLNYEVQPIGVRCAAPLGASWIRKFASNDPNTGTVASMPYKWVRIMMKNNTSEFPYLVSAAGSNTQPVCYDSSNSVQTILPLGMANCKAANLGWREVYVITALSVTPTGGRRITQLEATQIAIPPLPGAMTFTGSNPVFSAPNSNAFRVSGVDQNGVPVGGACATSPVGSTPAIGAQGAPADATLAGALPRPASYTGSGGSPSVQNVSSTGTNTLGPAYSTVGGLEGVVSAMTNAALGCPTPGIFPNTCGAGGTTTVPSGNFSGVTVINGPYSGGLSGTGILVVTGDLTMSGSPSFNGVILVIGTGKVTKNGGGNGTLQGGILIANLYDSSGNLLPPTSTPGVANVSWGGGGTSNICFDSTAMNMPLNGVLYKNLAYSELPY